MTNQAAQAYLLWLKDRGLVHPTGPRAAPTSLDRSEDVEPAMAVGATRRHRLILIGDLPTPEAHDLGRPLCGEEEALLHRMIQAMRLTDGDSLVVNALDRRSSQPSEAPDAATIAAARLRLADLVKVSGGELVVALGSFAAKVLLGDSTNFHESRGQLVASQVLDGQPVIATFHPRDLLRFPANKRLAWSDLQVAMRHLGLRTEHDA